MLRQRIRKNGLFRLLGGIVLVAMLLGLLAGFIAIAMNIFSFRYIEPILNRILRRD